MQDVLKITFNLSNSKTLLISSLLSTVKMLTVFELELGNLATMCTWLEIF